MQRNLIPWYHQLVGIDPSEQGNMDSTVLEFTNLTRELIIKIYMKKNGLNSGTASPLTGDVGRVGYAATQCFEKEKFPSFDGQRRNFPSFKRHWTSGVTPNYDKEFQLRQICNSVSERIGDCIKNLRSITKVWEVLNQEYGNQRELVDECIKSLTSIELSPRVNLTLTDFKNFMKNGCKLQLI